MRFYSLRSTAPVVSATRRNRRHQHALGAYCSVVLVRPLYPENLGAVARAMRVTGFDKLVLVQPGPLAHAGHPQALRMAVRSTDLLQTMKVVPSIDEALEGIDLAVGTSARAGTAHVLSPREAASWVCENASQQRQTALVFGSERTGLRRDELARCQRVVRIPMVANEPSLNLAQAVTVVLYELLVAAFSAH